MHPCMGVSDEQRGGAVQTCSAMQHGTFEPYKDDVSIHPIFITNTALFYLDMKKVTSLVSFPVAQLHNFLNSD